MKKGVQALVILLLLPFILVGAVVGVISAGLQAGWGIGREDFWQ